MAEGVRLLWYGKLETEKSSPSRLQRRSLILQRQGHGRPCTSYKLWEDRAQTRQTLREYMSSSLIDAYLSKEVDWIFDGSKRSLWSVHCKTLDGMQQDGADLEDGGSFEDFACSVTDRAITFTTTFVEAPGPGKADG